MQLVLPPQKKGCSLDGREAYNFFKSRNLADAIFGVTVYGTLKIGRPTIKILAKQYFELRYKELNLTCYQRSFCHHQINKIETFTGAASRLEPQLYSDQIMLMSSHYRNHVIESLTIRKGLLS